MTDFSRLIEHAFPLKQTSLDSVHEKNVRHGHISTLHIWPARRPLAACRAALIAAFSPYPDNPVFGRLSISPDGRRRAIEVKGRSNTGDVEVSSNEWSAACNHRAGYWLYAVYDCATPAARLVRAQDPFGSLLVKAKGSVLISATQISGAVTNTELGA